MAQRLISIIVPVYNSSLYLPRLFNNLMAQSIGFDALEIIFADDCSTDSSYGELQAFANQHSNVTLLKTSCNTGFAGAARNLALNFATSKYIMFLDADDTYTVNACELLYNSAEKSDADLVGGYYRRTKENGEYITIDNPPYGNLSQRSTVLPKQLRSELIIRDAFSCKIYKNDIIQKYSLHFLEGAPAEDIYFLYSYLLCISSSEYLAVPVYNYTVCASSVTQCLNKKFYIALGVAYTKIKELFDASGHADVLDLIFDGILEQHICAMADSDKMCVADISEALAYWEWLFLYENAMNNLQNQPMAHTILKWISEKDFATAADVLCAATPLRNAAKTAFAEISRLNAHSAALQSTVDAMRNSHIWRLTHPKKRGT
ncbi:MAG: glycosyltransferase family 2 protein [Oscillospiraceae bacterium]